MPTLHDMLNHCTPGTLAQSGYERYEVRQKRFEETTFAHQFPDLATQLPKRSVRDSVIDGSVVMQSADRLLKTNRP